MLIDNKQLRRLASEVDEYISNANYRNILLEELANNYVMFGTPATKTYVLHHVATEHPYFRISTINKLLVEAEAVRSTHMVDNNLFYDWNGSYILGGNHE
jgi:hypothetical protein